MECILFADNFFCSEDHFKQCLDTLESKLLTGLSLTNDLLTLEKLNVLKSENRSLNNQRKS